MAVDYQKVLCIIVFIARLYVGSGSGSRPQQHPWSLVMEQVNLSNQKLLRASSG